MKPRYVPKNQDKVQEDKRDLPKSPRKVPFPPEEKMAWGADKPSKDTLKMYDTLVKAMDINLLTEKEFMIKFKRKSFFN